MRPHLVETFGDPCRACGYDWSLPASDAAAIVAATPARYREAIAGCDGRERVAGLTWDLGSYVCHTADNTRIWAERLAGGALGVLEPVAPYDEDGLAVARGYAAIALPIALWSLDRAVADWDAAVALVGERPAVARHPVLGELAADDLLRVVAHEAHHHRVDIERIVSASAAR